MALAEWRLFEAPIPEREVLRLQGYTEGKRPHPHIWRIIAGQIEVARQLVQPQAVYRLMGVQEMDGQSLALEGEHHLKVGAGAREWRGAEYLALALGTIGPRLEAEVSRRLAGGNLAEAAYLDAAGSVATESLAHRVYSHLCQLASKMGLNCGPRLSPGHGGWALSDQEVFFQLLPAEKAGMSLNRRGLMLPLKSVSFAVGAGREFTPKPYRPCQLCGMAECAFRR